MLKKNTQEKNDNVSIPVSSTETASEKISASSIGTITIPLPGESSPAAPGAVASNSDAPVQDITPQELARRAKFMQPGVKSLIGIVNRTTVKIIRRRLATVCAKNQAEEMAETASLSDESIQVAAESGSRILARRVANEEAADYIALGGVAFEYLGGITDLLAEIKKLQQAQIAAHGK